jgi:hypothetical protein
MWSDPEKRQKILESFRRSWSDPELRARHSEIQKNGHQLLKHEQKTQKRKIVLKFQKRKVILSSSVGKNLNTVKYG